MGVEVLLSLQGVIGSIGGFNSKRLAPDGWCRNVDSRLVKKQDAQQIWQIQSTLRLRFMTIGTSFVET